MAKLPEEVTRTIMSSLADRTIEEPDDPSDEVKDKAILRRLFKRIAALFSESSESEAASPDESCEGCDTAGCASDCENTNELAYGYPPAYGVPAPIATKLLTEVYSLLQVLKVDDESLNARIDELKAKIARALGIAASASNLFADWLAEMRLAIIAQQEEQPVLSVSEAKERLRMSWDAFKAVVMEGQLAKEGRVFDSVFVLRAAIESAIRTFSALEMEVTKADEAQGQAEGQVDEPTSSDDTEIAPEGELKESETDVTAQAELAQENTEDNQASQANLNSENAEQKEESELVAMTDKGLDSVLAVLSSLSQQIEEINRRVVALEATVQQRRRVTQFVSSSASAENANADDLLHRWRSAATESERRKILREAQKQLASPIALPRDF